MTDDGSGDTLAKRVTKGAAKGAFSGAVKGGLAGGAPGVAGGAALGAAVGGGKEIIGAAIDRYRSPTERLRRKADLEQARALEANVEDLAAAVDELRAKKGPDEDLWTATLSRLRAFDEAWQTADDSRKARAIMAALMHSFDAEAYEAAISSRLIRTLKNLDCPEIWFLVHQFDDEGNLRMLSQLEGAETKTRCMPGTEYGEILRRLEDEHLVMAPLPGLSMIPQATKPTWLGDRLVEHLKKGVPESEDDESSDEQSDASEGGASDTGA